MLVLHIGSAVALVDNIYRIFLRTVPVVLPIGQYHVHVLVHAPGTGTQWSSITQ